MAAILFTDFTNDEWSILQCLDVCVTYDDFEVLSICVRGIQRCINGQMNDLLVPAVTAALVITSIRRKRGKSNWYMGWETIEGEELDK